MGYRLKKGKGTPCAGCPELELLPSFHVKHALGLRNLVQDLLSTVPSHLTMVSIMITSQDAEMLLKPFGIELDNHQMGQVMVYLELLLRWNKHLNLTGIHDESECVVKHFGESFYVCRYTRLRGRLLDIGSGAGFPGLALRIIFPDLHVVLLEPVAKKRVFLKEVARFCEFDRVEVRDERLEEFVREHPVPSFQVATSRAVGHFSDLLPLAARCLVPGGRLFLWISQQQGGELSNPQCNQGVGFDWGRPTPIPRSNHCEIWCGHK